MKTVALGLSGGVDSCASAAILKDKGYDVIALYFDVLKDGNKEALKRAKEAADKLGLEFEYRNLSGKFEKLIIEPFCNEYKNGRTPIPCAFCNPLIKFSVLEELNTDYIASGHYARLYMSPESEEAKYYIRKAVNLKKDQSYMLARLPQKILSKLILPLGGFESKEQVRGLVDSKGISAAKSKDSQDICFINGSYKDFLIGRGISSKTGSFISPEGKIYGPHNGIANYTLGQRKGLGIALGEPAFISEIDCRSGNIVLSTSNADLLRTEVRLENVFLHKDCFDKKYYVKLRYAANPAACIIKPAKDNCLLLTFDEPQRAPTPGQMAVIYDDDLVIGSGIIYN